MQKIEEKIIMYDSAEAAQQITITGWVSGGDKRFWYKDEHMARWSGCTHLKCECGKIMRKSYTKCDDCRHKLAAERYNALPFKEWNGEPVVEWDGDKYFFNEEDLIEYCEENEIKEIDLLFCIENNWRNIDEDYWADEMPDNADGELPKELQLALNSLNSVINTLPAQSYSPSKIRTKYIL